MLISSGIGWGMAVRKYYQNAIRGALLRRGGCKPFSHFPQSMKVNEYWKMGFDLNEWMDGWLVGATCYPLNFTGIKFALGGRGLKDSRLVLH